MKIATWNVNGIRAREAQVLEWIERDRPELENSPLVPAAVCLEVVRYVCDLDQAVGIVFGEDVWLQ